MVSRDKKDPFVLLSGFGKCVVKEKGAKLPIIETVNYYTAPEILKNNYMQKADIWACGVIMYMLLCGFPPFNSSESEVLSLKIKAGDWSFDFKEWEYSSDGAKDFITKLLTMDMAERPSARKALEHPWLVQMCKEELDADISEEIFTSLVAFKAPNSKLKHTALAFIASHLSTAEEKKERDKIFQILDENGDGVLTKNEILNGYNKISEH